MSGPRRVLASARGVVVAVVVLLAAAPARAEEGTGDGVRASAVVEALEAGAPSRAVAVAETLADRGFGGGVLAYHRGLAYARRVGTPEEAPGDGGQAIAAFLEARASGTTADLEARTELGLRAVRSQLARKRSAAGEVPAVEASPGLVRSTLLALPATGWLAIAGLFAAVSSLLALVAWRSAGEVRGSRVLGATLVGALAVSVSWAGAQSDGLRQHEATAVVVASRAPLLEAATGALAGDEALPEGIAVRVLRGDGATLRLVDRPERAIERTQLRLVSAP